MKANRFGLVVALGLSLLLAGSALAADAPKTSERGPAEVATDSYCDPWGPCHHDVVVYNSINDSPCGFSVQDYCSYYPYADNTCCLDRWLNCYYWEELTQQYRPFYDWFGSDWAC